jgi:hypothetical protein
MGLTLLPNVNKSTLTRKQSFRNSLRKSVSPVVEPQWLKQQKTARNIASVDTYSLQDRSGFNMVANYHLAKVGNHARLQSLRWYRESNRHVPTLRSLTRKKPNETGHVSNNSHKMVRAIVNDSTAAPNDRSYGVLCIA